MTNPADNTLTRIENLLACPSCLKPLNLGDGYISCSGCGARYPIQNGIPLMARMGIPDVGRQVFSGVDGNPSDPYQQQYQDLREAAQYNAEYKQKFFKRMSTRREFHILRRLLAGQGHTQVVLDVPSGGGRLSMQIAPFTDLLIEADIARGQVEYGKSNSRISVPQIWMTASAFCLPFHDNSIDAAICCRLCHHLPTKHERDALIIELLRVSKKFVLMTFFDYHSVKNYLRRIRQPFDHQLPKMTMKRQEIKDLAAQHGATLIDAPYLAPFSSWHRYALMVKSGARV